MGGGWEYILSTLTLIEVDEYYVYNEVEYVWL